MPHGAERTLLLVDDEAGVRHALRRLLRRDSYRILTAGDAREGLELLNEHRIQVIVSDQLMPGLSGVEFLGGVRETHPDTIRIILSGYTDTDTILRAINGGAIYRFFTKPWDDELLRRNIREAFEQYELQTENQRLSSELNEMNRELEQRVEKKTHQLKKSTRKLRRTLLQTIESVGLIMAKRDPFTATHQQHVAELVVAMGKRLGLEANSIEGLCAGALIHDIGKVYVPAEVLNRPARLSTVEMNIVRRHAEVGHEIMEKVEFPWPIGDVILQHHERLDGSGYPKGLRGDEIGRDARIIAVADVAEAMLAHRPHRAARSLEAVTRELQNGRGLRYDPEATDACLDALGSGEMACAVPPAPASPRPAPVRATASV